MHYTESQSRCFNGSDVFEKIVLMSSPFFEDRHQLSCPGPTQLPHRDGIFIEWFYAQANSNKPRESAAVRHPGSPTSMKSNL